MESCLGGEVSGLRGSFRGRERQKRLEYPAISPESPAHSPQGITQTRPFSCSEPSVAPQPCISQYGGRLAVNSNFH